MVAGLEQLSCDDVPFIADAPLASLRLRLIARRAHNQNEGIVSDRPLHELGELVSRNRGPLIKICFDAVGTQALRQPADPRFVFVVVPNRYEMNVDVAPTNLIPASVLYSLMSGV